jgi:hypothetical protein
MYRTAVSCLGPQAVVRFFFNKDCQKLVLKKTEKAELRPLVGRQEKKENKKGNR